MSKKDLLKEAIADAKAVRSTAIANAKLALEEAFTPKLQSMLSHKIAEEMDDELEEDDELAADTSYEDDEADDVSVNTEDMDSENEEADDTMSSDESYYESEEIDEMEDMDEDEMELEEIIKELEAEDESGDETIDENEDESEDLSEDGEEEEMDLEEIISALREEDELEEEEEEVSENEEELEEAYKVIRFLKSKINEVNLLNSKLLYSNKLFRSNSLSESQKMKVIETFDRANSVREVKLVYSTLSESITSYTPKRKVNESFASKTIGSTKPSKGLIVESNTFAARMQKLAGLK
jgi:predicted RNase H-like nuclease (RuvC/YqgF family)